MAFSDRGDILADLKDVRVTVTGAGSGIGLATATLFGRCGASVAANHLASDSAAKDRIAALADQGLKLIPVAGDVSDPEGAQRMIESAQRILGGLDVLVNNAGTPGTPVPIPFSDLDSVSEELWDTVLHTNLRGAFRTSKAAVAALRASKGAIVNVASVAGLGGDGSSIAYAASKAGLVNLTRNLAKGLGPDINVNAVAPGLTRTPWTENWSAARKTASIEKTMLKRFVEAQDVAQTILFLALQRAITGQTLAVDCGRQF